jgi:hypothetical protein
MVHQRARDRGNILATFDLLLFGRHAADLLLACALAPAFFGGVTPVIAVCPIRFAGNKAAWSVGGLPRPPAGCSPR